MGTEPDATSASPIKTSEDNWLDSALRRYKDKSPFTLIDDARIGLSADDVQSGIKLIGATKRVQRATWKQIFQIVTGLGMSSVGLALLYIAWVDPEPWSKLAVITAGGVLLFASGSFAILRALGQTWHVTVGPGGRFEVRPVS
jgi:hypothetical protein